jgi:hypothetical protein
LTSSRSTETRNVCNDQSSNDTEFDRKPGGCRADTGVHSVYRLGPFPANDPNKAVVWNNAAHTIATYVTAMTFTTTPTCSADSLAELQREPSGPALSGE